MEKSDFRETVFAFNKSDVVASYDLDMDIWHQNRVKMASVLCELLPFSKNANLRMVDLGVVTVYVSYKILKVLFLSVNGEGQMLNPIILFLK